MNKSHKIYYTEDECACESACEAMPVDYDNKFLDFVCSAVVEALRIPYQSQAIVKNLLYTALKDNVCSRDGWLEQFLHSELDKIAHNIKSRFNLDDTLKVNYNHATHAKLASIMDAIEIEYVKVDVQKDLRIIDIKSTSCEFLEIYFVVGVNDHVEADKQYIQCVGCEHDWMNIQQLTTKDTILYKCKNCSAYAIRIHNFKVITKV